MIRELAHCYTVLSRENKKKINRKFLLYQNTFHNLCMKRLNNILIVVKHRFENACHTLQFESLRKTRKFKAIASGVRVNHLKKI